MKVFISGAGGFIGRAVTAELALRGHEVVGLVRSEESATAIRRAGGRPVAGDLFDGGAWCRDVSTSDRIISLTQPFKPGEDIPLDKMELYGRKHAEAVTNLIKAAADGMTRAIIVTFDTECYGDRKDKWLTGSAPMDPVGHCRPLTGSFKAIARVGEDAEIPLINVYPSLVYGNGGWFRRMVEDIQNGNARMVEPGDNYLNLIHLEDLAVFYALAVEKLDRPETLWISDNRPVRQKTMMDYLAAMLGRPPLEMLDLNTYAGRFGLMAAEAFSCSTRVPGIKAMDILNYVPRQSNYEAGIKYTLKQMGIEPVKRLEAA